jgi:hypothetical protein
MIARICDGRAAIGTRIDYRTTKGKIIMRHALLGLASLAVTLTLLPASAAAQDWSQPWADPQDRPPRFDLSGSAGFLMPTSWSSLVLIGSIAPVSGVVEQVLARDLRVEPDIAYSGTATYWRGRYGFRTRAGFSRSSLTIGGSLLGDQGDARAETSVGMDTWLYDVGGAIGFLEYTPQRWVWPYGFVGFGGVTHKLEQTVGPPLTFIRGGALQTGDIDRLVVADRGREFLLAVDELRTETSFALNFGVGTDVRIPVGPVGVGLRFEVSDHMAPSPVGLRIRELSRAGAFASEGVNFGVVHNLSATAGVMLRFGR